MALKPWSEVCPEPLVFPIGSKEYTLPELSKDDGIKLQFILAGQDKSLDGQEPEQGWRLVMGPVWDQMNADGVSYAAMARAAFTALADLTQGREAAEKVWESGIDPEALAAAMAATQTEQTPSTPTAVATKTSSRASTSGTRTSRPTSRAKPKASRS